MSRRESGDVEGAGFCSWGKKKRRFGGGGIKGLLGGRGSNEYRREKKRGGIEKKGNARGRTHSGREESLNLTQKVRGVKRRSRDGGRRQKTKVARGSISG